ncbi:MAG TPA: YceI family protein [Blastocatellia bacterium]|nr:YceI family protein [Blastocatellia bacterium]
MIRRIIVLIACMTLLAVTAKPQTKARTYTIVSGESSFWVFVPKAGLLSGFAHDHQIGVKSFSGKIVVPESGAGGGSLELDVDATSLVVLDTKPSEDDKKKIQNSMHNEVLESAKYPKVVFKSASVTDLKSTGGENYSFTLNGDLTLHGVTKRIAIPVSLTINAKQLRAEGKYLLRQTDFSIKPFSAAGGTVKVKNEITVNFNIVAKAA